jgi:PhnB protein
MTTDNGYRSVTAYLCAKGAAAAIDFYTQAFGAVEKYRMGGMPGDEDKIGHAEIAIGETTIMLSDEWPEGGVFSPTTLKGTSTSFVLDVGDADGAFQRAVDAGATVERPLKDEPYGRSGWLVDPFGHRWCINQPNPNFKPEDMQS